MNVLLKEVKLEHHDNADFSPGKLHGLQGIFKDPNNLVRRLIIVLEAVAHAKPSPFEPDGELHWNLLADALEVKNELFANLEPYDLLRTVVTKMAHIHNSSERLNKARERLGHGNKPTNETERVDDLLWTLLLLRTQQKKRSVPALSLDSVTAASSQAPATRLTNDVRSQKAAPLEKMVPPPVNVITPRPDAFPDVASQTPVTQATNEVAVQNAVSQEKTIPPRSNIQPGPRDYEQQGADLRGKEQDLQGTRKAHSGAGEVVGSRIVDLQEQETPIKEKTPVPQGTKRSTKEKEVLEDGAANLQEYPLKFIERQKMAAQQQEAAQPKSQQNTQLASAPAPAQHRSGHIGKYQENEQRSFTPRLSSQGGAFISGPSSYSLVKQEASSASSTNGSRKRDASSFQSTPFSSPPPQYLRGSINDSQNSHTIPETAGNNRRKSHGLQRSSLEVSPDVVVVEDEEPTAKRARWPSLPMQTWSFSVKDRVRTGPDPIILGLTSGTTKYSYQQPIAPPNDPTKITPAPLTRESNELLQNYIRQSQEKLDHFLQHVADQGALRDSQVSNMARDISHLKSNMDAIVSDFTTLRATNTMVIQSMNMMMEENQRLRETVNALIGKLDSSK
ncbi:hypothetical protein BG006_010660 [Podila minutissima]|uniref:Uncharacterized protein n=1 Tax=Podila minutissima TaxID=64525 RepID=A0A9P5SR59_9FUNG|nr:hypothetical protein BG006_010660 [Podila minutissima]